MPRLPIPCNTARYFIVLYREDTARARHILARVVRFSDPQSHPTV